MDCTVNSIYEDRHGTLWFGTIDGTLNKFEPTSEKFVHYKIDNVESPNIKDNGILRIHEGNDGMLWACAANGGLIRLDGSTGQYTQFTNSSSNPHSISSNHVLSIAEDSDRILWIGTAGGGLNKLDSSSNKFIHYGINEPDSATQTINYNVNAIVNDNGILWLATDRGLFKFDKNSGKSVFVEDSQQIANTFISGLLKDGKDNLWLSTANGLSMVSHEIRTPLSAILGFTELIAGKIEKTILPNIDLKDEKIQKAAEKISRDLNIIISEGDRLSTLVNNLLNISKIESGKMDWKSEILDISEIIEQALSITKPIIEKAGLTIHVDTEADLPKVSGDKDMLTQVFINLISNAVKFTREGYIKVCAKNSGNKILVSIEDTGVGIREDHLNKVFERFYQADPSFARNKGNNNVGLGLYICKEIIEKHGGIIWVESQLGEGSTFYFTILHL